MAFASCSRVFAASPSAIVFMWPISRSLVRRGAIELGDIRSHSSRVSIYSNSDDYSGATMSSPTVPAPRKNVLHADVFIGRHVIIGSSSEIMPGVTLGRARWPLGHTA
jgi:acetyltransferase-like isoleucine patch superfamily enzyme